MYVPKVVAEPTTAELVAGFAAIRHELDVPADFPGDILTEAIGMADRQRPGDADRRDHRELPLVTLDPPGSRDLDQALHIERRTGGFRVWYAIADVAAFVDAGGLVDGEARRRGLTRYTPDRRAPLHPEVLSEGAASLLPDQDRPAVLWRFDLDGAGMPVATTVVRAIVRSRSALTYPAVDAALRFGSASETMLLLREVGRLREGLEAERGGVHLDLPTQQVVADDGRYELAYRNPLPIEGWNAQVSLLTGMEAARLMVDGGLGILRTLPPPHRGVVAAIRRSARTLGVAWPEGLPYATFVRQIDRSTPQGAALVTQSARALRGAGYFQFDGTPPVGDDGRHGAVAAPYAHVTAPLRRLVDRFANEIVLALAADRPPPPWARAALPELPKLMGAAHDRESVLSCAVLDYVETMILRHRVGTVFPVVVTDLDDRRAVIQLRDPAVLASVEPDGRRLGEELDVRLVASDPATRRVTFEPV